MDIFISIYLSEQDQKRLIKNTNLLVLRDVKAEHKIKIYFFITSLSFRLYDIIKQANSCSSSSFNTIWS